MTHIFQPLDLTIDSWAKNFLKERYATWYALQITVGLEKGLAVDEIDVKTPLAVIKLLHTKWVMNLHDKIISEKGKEIVLNAWKAAEILDAEEMLSAKLKCLDHFNDIDPLGREGGILSASRMIFSSPKKVTGMLMNDTNQFQMMNMFWMTNKMPSVTLLFRSSLVLTNFLKHFFVFTLFIKRYSWIFVSIGLI